MTFEISADPETLLRQASMTASEYFDNAIRHIDGAFGEGYAEQNPNLVAAFMQAASADLVGSITAQQLRAGMADAAESIGAALRDAAQT